MYLAILESPPVVCSCLIRWTLSGIFDLNNLLWRSESLKLSSICTLCEVVEGLPFYPCFVNRDLSLDSEATNKKIKKATFFLPQALFLHEMISHCDELPYFLGSKKSEKKLNAHSLSLFCTLWLFSQIFYGELLLTVESGEESVNSSWCKEKKLTLNSLKWKENLVWQYSINANRVPRGGKESRTHNGVK